MVLHLPLRRTRVTGHVVFGSNSFVVTTAFNSGVDTNFRATTVSWGAEAIE